MRGASTLSQVAVTVFVAVPSTIALVAALAVYCTYQFVSFALFPKPQTLNLAKEPQPQPVKGEENFTASLTNLAEIHAPAVKVETAANQEVSHISNQ